MGEHARHSSQTRTSAETRMSAGTTFQAPTVYAGTVPRQASPMLAVIKPVHRERMDVFHKLQIELADARDLAAVIVDDNGYPVLSVVRVDGSRSMAIGCVYWNGAWWLATPEARPFARADDIPAAAAAIKRAMRS